MPTSSLEVLCAKSGSVECLLHKREGREDHQTSQSPHHENIMKVYWFSLLISGLQSAAAQSPAIVDFQVFERFV
jgi:hypothetical protein